MHPTHPSLEYLLVAAIAAAGCFLATPLARAVAVRWHAIASPRDRDVHAVAIPRMGGTAIYVGLAIAVFVASRLPTLHETFKNNVTNGKGELGWILVAAGLLCLLGALDDRYELDSLTKLAGQVLATGIMVTLGKVQLVFLWMPWSQATFVLGQDLAIPITIFLTVLTINAVNFIDGLDGLAAGVSAIGAVAFFLFSYHLGATFGSIAAAPTLLSAALAGACIGFLPHNFFPARIFMGDSGSMVIGLMLSAAAITATTTIDPQGLSGSNLKGLPLLLPLLIPLSVLAIPFIDLLLAVIRRVSKGQSPFAPDKKHLHHRLLALGHSHRRAVLLLYFWAAVLSFGAALLSISEGSRWVLALIVAIGVVLGTLLLIVPRIAWRLRARNRRQTAAAHAAADRPSAGRVSDACGAHQMRIEALPAERSEAEGELRPD